MQKQMDNVDLTPLLTYVPDLEQEIPILKTTLESVFARSDEYVPMVIFYDNTGSKLMVVAPNSFGDINQKMLAIAETMHLYASLSAGAALVTLQAKMSHNDEIYSCLNIFLLTQPYAWLIQYPYNLENQSVTWLSHLNNIEEIDSIEMDETGKDVATMFYHMTHIDIPMYTTQEILSYLSKTGAAIGQVSSNIQYIDFSTE